LQKRLGFDHLSVINDFTAISLSLLKLPPEGTVSVGPGADLGDAKRLGVIGPGTGLGVGGLIRHNGATLPVPSSPA
jgi:glucokinase